MNTWTIFWTFYSNNMGSNTELISVCCCIDLLKYNCGKWVRLGTDCSVLLWSGVLCSSLQFFPYRTWQTMSVRTLSSVQTWALSGLNRLEIGPLDNSINYLYCLSAKGQRWVGVNPIGFQERDEYTLGILPIIHRVNTESTNHPNLTFTPTSMLKICMLLKKAQVMLLARL